MTKALNRRKEWTEERDRDHLHELPSIVSMWVLLALLLGMHSMAEVSKMRVSEQCILSLKKYLGLRSVRKNSWNTSHGLCSHHREMLCELQLPKDGERKGLKMKSLWSYLHILYIQSRKLRKQRQKSKKPIPETQQGEWRYLAWKHAWCHAHLDVLARSM